MHKTSIAALALALAVPLALIGPPARAQGVPNLDTGGTCAERYPGNPRLQASCGRTEAQDQRWIENAKVPNDVWRKCRGAGGDSYSDMANCMRVGAKAAAASEGGAAPTMTAVPFDPASEAAKASHTAG